MVVLGKKHALYIEDSRAYTACKVSHVRLAGLSLVFNFLSSDYRQLERFHCFCFVISLETLLLHYAMQLSSLSLQKNHLVSLYLEGYTEVFYNVTYYLCAFSIILIPFKLKSNDVQ